MPINGAKDYWAKDYNYPLEDSDDLPRVAQFTFPKEEIIDQFEGVHPHDFSQVDEPHSALASLPLSVCTTTNYDNIIVQPLKQYRRNLDLEIFGYETIILKI